MNELISMYKVKCSYRGVDIAEDILRDRNRKFLVYGDPDIDGMLSCYLATRWCALNGIPSAYYVNENRLHGFYLDADIEGYTILAVDFGMTREEVQSVVDRGANIVLLDHHAIGYDEVVEVRGTKNGVESRGVIINNQYSFESAEHRFFSGAGVVYQVLSSIDERMVCEDNMALVGVTLLSDIREIENDIARSILSVTYRCNTELFRGLVSKTQTVSYGMGYPRMDRQFIDYVFSPRFNALFRANRGFEAIEFMLGKRLPMGLLDACKALQDRILGYILANLRIREYRSFVYGEIDDVPMGELLKRMGFNMGGFDFSSCRLDNYIGVACSRLKGDKSALLCVVKDGKVLRGSFRGVLDDANYLTAVRYLGVEADGHQVAFGVLSLNGVDLGELDELLGGLERYTGDNRGKRLVEVSNLHLFNEQGGCTKMSRYNIFVRSNMMCGIKYTGTNCECVRRGKLYEWKIDGVIVKSFSESVTPHTGVIVPMRDRDYLVLYLRESIS